MCTYIYIYIYIYKHIHAHTRMCASMHISLSLYIYTYVYICAKCIYLYTYIYICIHRRPPELEGVSLPLQSTNTFQSCRFQPAITVTLQSPILRIATCVLYLYCKMQVPLLHHFKGAQGIRDLMPQGRTGPSRAR